MGSSGKAQLLKDVEVLESAGLDVEDWPDKTFVAMKSLASIVRLEGWPTESVNGNGVAHHVLRSLLAVLTFLASAGVSGVLEEGDVVRTAADTVKSSAEEDLNANTDPLRSTRRSKCFAYCATSAFAAVCALEGLFNKSGLAANGAAPGSEPATAVVAAGRRVALALVQAGAVDLCARAVAAQPPSCNNAPWQQLINACINLLACMSSVARAAEKVRPPPAAARTRAAAPRCLRASSLRRMGVAPTRTTTSSGTRCASVQELTRQPQRALAGGGRCIQQRPLQPCC